MCENMWGLTLEQVTKAKSARDMMAMMAHPSKGKIKHLVSSNNKMNVPFTSTGSLMEQLYLEKTGLFYGGIL